jgi:hypothetical protein
VGSAKPKAPQESHLLKGFVDDRLTWSKPMNSVMPILKQAAWGLIALLVRLKPNIPLKGRIRASVIWDFRGER